MNLKHYAFEKTLKMDEQYIRSVFDVFDINGDGNIDAQELQTALFPSIANAIANADANMNLDEHKDEAKPGFEALESVKHIIEEVDENNDKLISFEEFKKAMKEDIDAGRFDPKTFAIGGQII